MHKQCFGRSPLRTLEPSQSTYGRMLVEGATVAEMLDPRSCTAGLLPEEEQLVAGASEMRRREFTAGRCCARLALQRLGVEPTAIGIGSFREPLFPSGVAGSITHTRDFCAAAVIRTGPVLSIGIDAELNRPLDQSIVDIVLTLQEQQMIRDVNCGCNADTLVFSIKESFFKATFSLIRQYLGFSDAVVTLSPEDCTFAVSPRGAWAATRLQGLRVIGRYRFDERHVYTAVSLIARSGRS